MSFTLIGSDRESDTDIVEVDDEVDTGPSIKSVSGERLQFSITVFLRPFQRRTGSEVTEG